jgi:hypothetical protein
MRHANPRKDNLPLVFALILFGLFVIVTLLGVDVAIGQGENVVENPTFDGLDYWDRNNPDWVTHTLEYDYAGEDGSAKYVTHGGEIYQTVTLDQGGLWHMRFYALADDPDCRFLHCLGGTCYNSPVNTTAWQSISLADVYDAGDVEVSIQWWDTTACTSTEVYADNVEVWREPDPTATPTPTNTPTAFATPTPTPGGTPTRKPTPTPTPLPELPWLTENPYFLDWSEYWQMRPPQTFMCEWDDPYYPCVRMRQFGELRQTFYNDNYGQMIVAALARQDTCPADTVQLELCLGVAHDPPFSCEKYNMTYNSQDEYYTVYDYMEEGMYTVYYRNYSVGCPNSEIVVQVAGALWYEQEPPEETPTPTPVATWFVPPSPTPRVVLSTPIGSSNISFIQQQATLVIGWVGPALFGILFAAFAWATGVFNWLWSLATWLFSGAWRGGGEMR